MKTNKYFNKIRKEILEMEDENVSMIDARLAEMHADLKRRGILTEADFVY